MPVTKEDFIRLARFRTAVRHFLRFSESQARAAGITPQQHQMMLVIKGMRERDWATPGEIAEALQVNHNTAVGLVARAEAAGLVCRAEDPIDRRRVRVAVTDRGEQILEDLTAEHKREVERISPAFLGLFTATLEREE